MLNRYKNANKELKEFKVSRINKGSTRNGKKYTVFQIADSKKDANDNRIYDNWGVFVWHNLDINEGDKITLDEISALDTDTKTVDGKTYVNKTIFASVTVIPAEPKGVEVVGELQPLDDLSGELPF